jgi:hypothetical protein
MRNTLDNLRFVSIQENNQNKNLYANNTTGYRGVFRYKNKFMAQIKHNGRAVYSKVCATAEEAAHAWNENVVRFRNIHMLNEVDEPENEPDPEPEAQQ